MKKSIGLLFGAGAEIAYGLPSGGKLALDIFRNDNNGKKEFKNILEKKIKSSSKYANSWLPKNFETKLISSFGKNEYRQIIDSTLENKRYMILSFVRDFDNKAKALLKTDDFKTLEIDKCFQDITKETPENYYLNNDIAMHQFLNDQINLFSSTYFSLFMKVIQTKEKDTLNLKKIIRAFIELWIGAIGQEFLQDINTNIFQTKNDTFSLDIFSDFTDFFSFNSKHISCLDILYSNNNFECKETSSNYNKITFFAFKLLIQLLESSIDYQELVDSYYNYLYKPQSEWTKFCKISTFLYGVQKYITKNEKIYKEKAKEDGYYADLRNFPSDSYELHIGTTNYNRLIEGEVFYLNGSVDDYYDPYQNKILTTEENKKSEHITVPLLFTQSGIKPITSVSMTLRYSQYYNNLKNSDLIAVLGFGFNSDDGHINCLFRELVLQKKKIFIFDHGNKGKRFYLDKLRLEEDYETLKVMPIDSQRKSGDEYWYNILINEVS